MVLLFCGAGCGRLDFNDVPAVVSTPAAVCTPPVWTQQVVPVSTANPDIIYDINALAADDIYAVGFDGILHSTGDGSWQVLDQPKTPAGTPIALYGVWGVGPSEAYVVGNYFSGSEPELDHVTNGVVTREANPGTQVLNSAWSSSPTDVYVVGYAGLIMHSAGDGNWQVQVPVFSPPPPSPDKAPVLYQIWGSAANDIYAAGSMGTILHSTGDGTWTQQPTGVVPDLIAIWGSSAHDIYAAGHAGTVLHSTGDGTWTQQTTPPDADLFAIWGAGPDKIYAAGKSDYLFYSCGDGVWNMAAPVAGATQYDAFTGTANDIYVAGTPSVILHGP
jgi:photosystem II stability/assembly factor-like uncharacterized protein